MRASIRRNPARPAADALRLCEQGKAVARKHFENGKPVIVVTARSASWQVRVPRTGRTCSKSSSPHTAWMTVSSLASTNRLPLPGADRTDRCCKHRPGNSHTHKEV